MGPLPVAGPVGHARGEIALQIAAQAEGARGLSQCDEDIVHHVFGGVGIVEKRHRHAQQVVQVFLVDPPQRIFSPELEPQLQ